MPTYDYRCKKGHVFELFHGMSDDSPKRCPKCRSLAKRVPGGGAGLLFKGSGFYITDYRSANYKKSAKSETSEKTAKPEKSEKPGGTNPKPSGPAGGGKPAGD